MKKIYPLSIIVAILLSTEVLVAQETDARYFDQSLPDLEPKVFAPGKISTEQEFEFGAIFSKDRNEFYYAVAIGGKAETRRVRFENGRWTAPEKILVHDVYSYNDPFLAPGEQKLFFISDRPLNGQGPKKGYDIWYVERQGSEWSEPRNAGKNINSIKNEYYISFTGTGKMYFSSNKEAKEGNDNYDIYSSEVQNNKFEPAVKLGPGVNTPAYEADVFVAPDESYLVFAANRPEGLGVGDLYVSFRKSDGTWTQSKSLGDAINTETDDFCPFVTADGKYLFYASRGDIYWVSTKVIEKMR